MPTVPAPVNLSAAFYRVNCNILQSQLSGIGISGVVLAWFISYLSDRQSYILIREHKSDTASLIQGVPQGSVLGPILFNIYELLLGAIICQSGLSFHCYAEDTQLYISIDQTASSSPVLRTDNLCEMKHFVFDFFMT